MFQPFDLLDSLKFFSINAQRFAGILIGKEQFQLDLLAFIRELKDHDLTHTIIERHSILF